MSCLKLLGKIPILSILLLVAFLLGADRGQTSSRSTTAFNQKVTTTTPIFNSNTNSKLRLIERPWLVAQRQSRVALVIGNGSYEEAPLRNPVNDANDIAAALKNLGFELIDNRALLNLNKREMNDAIDKFRERLRQGGVGTFYYAGHGVAIEGVNYLIPVNADLDAKEDVEYEAIPLRKVINNMQATETQFNFIIVDACRDNPIYRQWRADRRSGRRPQGFAEEKDNLARGTLIFYATRYGRTARDGRGRNSTFTTHLLKHIGTRNLRVVDLMSKVADGVEKETDFEQVPWQEGSIRGGPFFLSRISESDPTPQASTGSTTVAVPQPTPDTTSEDEQRGVELLQEAVQLIRSRQYEQAMPKAKLATQLAPNKYESWFILGSLYVQQEKVDLGIEVLEQAETLAPEEEGILFTLGNAYFQKGEYEIAKEKLEAGLEIEANSPEALLDLGNAYVKLAEPDKAIASYYKSFAQEASFWPAITNAGLFEYEQGKVDKAIENWSKALEIDTEQAEPKLALAVALYSQGDTQEGIEMGISALESDNRYAEILFLQENLWGNRLIEDTKKFFENPQIQAFLTPNPTEERPIHSSSTTLISKTTGVDYTRLRDLLRAEEWYDADEETKLKMFQAAGKLDENLLREKDIDNFPCEDLRIIDQLWLESSQGKFGFSVQKEIYESLGGTSDYNEEVWDSFGDRVGWRKGGQQLNYWELTFKLNAPAAHLPTLASRMTVIKRGKRYIQRPIGSHLFSLTKTCWLFDTF